MKSIPTAIERDQARIKLTTPFVNTKHLIRLG